ncbi:MAG: UDP-3-O-(3-hydroxymyristoyl)glucosamine N-acyltransferase [Holosporales bacterium]|jgi:UDP-3-O-[3-hydroxymyristoyl] glucosamine N-acyltransferase|nr:UDP-3-O-(3-hydroxymyristoyl)glucosamine N-acyltransferase [Holosporales bacterium]
MVDQRFYSKKPYLTIVDICRLLNTSVPAGCPSLKRIENVAPIDKASNSDITFFHNPKYADVLAATKAGACLISREHAHLVPLRSVITIIVDDPHLAYVTILNQFYTVRDSERKGYISKKASIAKSAAIEDGCYISDFVVISDDAIIKSGTFIGENTVIMRGVEIGENSYICSNVTIGFATIGRDAHIKAGARIGQPGFGFHIGKAGPTDIRHIGTVIIGDNVMIGANCTIDRGSLSDTVIGSNTRIDNLVHIAHNVTVGSYCVIAAQTGIAGSTKLGNACVLGGQVGIAGHLTIGDNVTVAAQSGVMRNVQSGSKIAGTPSTSIMSWHRQTIALQRLATPRLA